MNDRYQVPLLKIGSRLKVADHDAVVVGIEQLGVRLQVEGMASRPLVSFPTIEYAATETRKTGS